MARRPQNRMELRRQYEAAEPPDPVEDESEDVTEETDDEEERRPKKRRAPAKSKAKSTKATKAAKPTARMRIVWAVVNDAFKTVATFEYSQKEAALAKAAEMTAKGKGTHFVQKVKEAIAEDAPGLGASIPREATSAPKSAKAAPAASVEVEVEEEDEDEDEGHDDEDEGHDDDDE